MKKKRSFGYYLGIFSGVAMAFSFLASVIFNSSNFNDVWVVFGLINAAIAAIFILSGIVVLIADREMKYRNAGVALLASAALIFLIGFFTCTNNFSMGHM